MTSKVKIIEARCELCFGTDDIHGEVEGIGTVCEDCHSSMEGNMCWDCGEYLGLSHAWAKAKDGNGLHRCLDCADRWHAGKE